MGVKSTDFERFLVDPTIPRAQKVTGLNAIFTELKFSDTTKRFFGAPANESPTTGARGDLISYCGLQML